MPISAANKAKYPRDWKAISERIRFGRAKGRCECEGECGAEHSVRCHREHGDELRRPAGGKGRGGKVILTVAHLDHDPGHCADDNLRAMCQRCHLAYDLRHHQRNAASTRRSRKAIGELL